LVAIWGRAYISQAEIFNELGVEIASLDYLFDQRVHDKVEVSVLEATLVALSQRCSDGESDDNVIGVLLSAVSLLSVTVSIIHHNVEPLATGWE
jgi:hypothetical protein